METKMFDPFLCKIFYATKCWGGTWHVVEDYTRYREQQIAEALKWEHV